MEGSDAIVRLKCKDGKVFEITENEGSISEFLREAIQKKGEDGCIDVEKVKSDCLEKVVSYLKHYAIEKMNDIQSLHDESTLDEVIDQKWYQDFVSDEQLDRSILFEVMAAANHMGIKPLLDLTSLKVTFQMMDRDEDGGPQMLMLPELTSEDEVQNLNDHKWNFED